MESSYLVVFSCVGGALLLVSVLSTLILWARISALDDGETELVKLINEKAAPKQIEQALATADSARSRIDTALLELGKFRDQVHSEMQRFYAIMRRNEKAAGFVEGQQALGSTKPPEAETPDEISASDLKPAPETEGRESKVELRRRARQAGL